MSRHLAWFLSAVVMLAMSAPLQALNYEVGGCKTGTGYVNFTTISAAVAGVPAGSKILVCPGVYPEQVTITQPLTLKGIASGNASRAVIAINPNGNLAPNVTSITGQSLYAQLLVQNSTPNSPITVNIIGITVDGAGGNVGCGTGLAGIFYASGTSGTINEITARHQQSSDCGNGIWVENGAGLSQTITVENSSVHNMDGSGIVAISDQNPLTLTAAIRGDFVSDTAVSEPFGSTGIYAQGTSTAITGNIITGGTNVASQFTGIATDQNESGGGGITVSGNVVADIPEPHGESAGISPRNGTIVQSNKVSNVYVAFFPQAITVGPTIQSNTSMNTKYALAFNCIGNSTTSVSGNIFSDSGVGLDTVPSQALIGHNSFYNIDTVQADPCP
jgi:hypothetical protein